MTIQLTIDPETERRLHATARDSGADAAEVAAHLLADALRAYELDSSVELSREDWSRFGPQWVGVRPTLRSDDIALWMRSGRIRSRASESKRSLDGAALF